mgnify:CR=1 FL=1
MRKIIISVIIVLLLILAFVAIYSGISLGGFTVLSVKQIISGNQELDSNIAEVNSLLKKDFPNKKDELSTAVAELLDKKEEYFNIAKVSTEGEINKASTEEIYLIEYLWTRVGRHATSEGVNLKMDVYEADAGDQEVKNLGFTVEGRYVGIIDFIYAIEDDSELNFKIENFKLVPNSDNTNLTATFDVKNIRIKQENTTVSASETETTTDATNTVAQDQNAVDVNTVTDQNTEQQVNAVS